MALAGVALTLRHDRLDKFWFALLYEWAHVGRHLTPECPVFIDDLDRSNRAAPATSRAHPQLVPVGALDRPTHC
jgi:HTH-type transcriptional regulator/antitoxin HigA